MFCYFVRVRTWNSVRIHLERHVLATRMIPWHSTCFATCEESIWNGPSGKELEFGSGRVMGCFVAHSAFGGWPSNVFLYSSPSPLVRRPPSLLYLLSLSFCTASSVTVFLNLSFNDASSKGPCLGFDSRFSTAFLLVSCFSDASTFWRPCPDPGVSCNWRPVWRSGGGDSAMATVAEERLRRGFRLEGMEESLGR